MTRALALVGDPVSTSVSPAMHRAAFEQAGLDWTYEAVTIPRGALPDSWPTLRDRFHGLNVTVPHKEAVLALLDRISPSAGRARSVNTVTFEGDLARGESTDGPGFIAALSSAGVTSVRRAVILGTGGAARAVVMALRDLGAEVVMAGRNATAGPAIASGVGARFIPSDAEPLLRALATADLLVNATPLGGEAGLSGSPLPDVPLPGGAAVFDLVYRPRRTPLLERAAAAGCRTIEGIEMLIEQGARSFEIWTGVPAPVEAMRQAARAALGVPAPVAGTR